MWTWKLWGAPVLLPWAVQTLGIAELEDSFSRDSPHLPSCLTSAATKDAVAACRDAKETQQGMESWPWALWLCAIGQDTTIL